MKWKWFIVVLNLPFFLTACWDSQEIEHTRYIHAIGIDYQKNKVKVYIQVISFSNIAKQEGVGGQTATQPMWIGKGEGTSFDLATDAIYHTAQQRVSWSHLAAMVFTEKALEHPEIVQAALDTTDRYNDIRNTLWVYGTSRPLIDLFSAKPILGQSAAYSKLASPMSNYRQYSTAKPIQLFEFIAQLNDGSKTSILPFLATTKTRWNKDKEPFEVTINDGIGIIQNNQFKGHLSSSDIQGLRWVQKDTVRAPLYLYNGEKPLSTIVFQKPKTEIVPRITDKKLSYTLNVKGKGTIIQMDQRSTEKELKKKAADAIRKQIKNTYMQGLKRDADVYRLSDALYRDDPKMWHYFSKNGGFKLDSNLIKTINIDVQISNSGKTKFRRKKEHPL